MPPGAGRRRGLANIHRSETYRSRIAATSRSRSAFTKKSENSPVTVEPELAQPLDERSLSLGPSADRDEALLTSFPNLISRGGKSAA
jgi:hypothetical protein